MEIIKILRVILGLVTMLVILGGLYALFRLYSYFYFSKSAKEEQLEEPKVMEQPKVQKKRYNRPTFLYDSEKHEFYIKSET